MNEDIWFEIFDYNTFDTLKISLNVSRLFNKLSNNILKDIVYGLYNGNIIIMKKLHDTETNEDRYGIVNKKYAKYKANKLMIYESKGYIGEKKYMYDVDYYLREECVTFDKTHGKHNEWYDDSQLYKVILAAMGF